MKDHIFEIAAQSTVTNFGDDDGAFIGVEGLLALPIEAAALSDQTKTTISVVDAIKRIATRRLGCAKFSKVLRDHKALFIAAHSDVLEPKVGDLGE